MRQVLIWFVLCLSAVPLWADTSLSEKLVDVLKTPRLLEQLALEAERSAEDINRDFLNGDGGPVYADTVARLNDPERVLPKIGATLAANMTPVQMEQVIAFYASPLGQNIIQLELSARATIFDPSVDAAVRSHVAGEGVPDLVADMIVQGDLIERNVTDALRVLQKFYRGRVAGGATDIAAGEVDAFVEQSRDSIRFETQLWLEAFMTLAYSPLSDEDLQTYADFWRTQAGQAFDRALFEAYALVFEENSFALGQMVGRLGASDEI